MTTVTTRPPLRLTRSEATNWFSTHGEDVGREIIIVDWKPAEIDPSAPIRSALGYNARGEWVWADDVEGRWP